ncbi:MAG: TatD family hydrolase [Eubacteriales bacterium]|nr:TatD family hydrolase [Eubacteriales bacterium]
MIFDTHTHYDDEAYDNDREELIASLPENGVGLICNIGASMQGSRDSISLSGRFPYVYAAVGVHPDEVAELDESAFAELKALAGHEKAVAIGEIGLDYHGYDIYDDKPDKETQQYWFKRQLELAIELDMPVVIHSRNAAADTLEMMVWAHENGLKCADIHCYSYSKEQAMQYLDMGFYLGIGGVLTYEGQKKLTKTVETMPVERILLETDCPYLTPAPVRKTIEKSARNSSVYLTYVRDRIAELKGVAPDVVERVTYENACRFYGIDKTAAV